MCPRFLETGIRISAEVRFRLDPETAIGNSSFSENRLSKHIALRLTESTGFQ